MKHSHRRLVIELGPTGTLTVDDPLSLVGKSVTITLTGATITKAEIHAAANARKASAEIVCDAESIAIAADASEDPEAP